MLILYVYTLLFTYVNNFLGFKEKIRASKYMECQCCFSDDVPIEDVIPCKEGHVFCKDCVKR